jgi:hypothetical protein
VAQRRGETLATAFVRRTETAVRQQLDGRQFETQFLPRGRAFRRLPNDIDHSRQSGNPRQQPVLGQGHQTTHRTSSTHSTTTLHKVRVRIESWQKEDRTSPASLPGQTSHQARRLWKEGRLPDVLSPVYNRRSVRRRDCIM